MINTNFDIVKKSFTLEITCNGILCCPDFDLLMFGSFE